MWQELTDAILADAFQPAELASITGGEPDTAAVTSVLSGVAALIRGRIRSNGRMALQGSETAIPAEMKMVATDIVRYQILLRYDMAVSDDRRKAYEQAMQTLEDIAKGEVVLADAATPAQPAPIWNGHPQQWGAMKKHGVM